MRTVRLEYGREGLAVNIPEGCEAAVLEQRSCRPVGDVTAAVRSALEAPIASPPLRRLAERSKTACVLVSDKTRPVPNAAILPPLLEILRNAGMRRENILVLIATGLHGPNEGEDLVRLVGKEVAGGYRIENHRWNNASEHVSLGCAGDGVPVEVDRRYVEAELKIATGLIEPHLLAGYSGGRKAICPGICSLETLKKVHGPVLLDHPNAKPGVLDGNPFHLAALAVARKAGLDFILNVTLDRERRITGVFAGEMEKAHAAGVDFCDGYTRVSSGGAVDAVVTTGGGFPLDETYYQAIKGAFGAMEIVKPGGTIVLAARCNGGLGSGEFREVLRCAPDARSVMAMLHSPGFFKKDQWMVQHLCHVLDKADVILCSDGLSADLKRGILVRTAASVEAALDSALQKTGSGARVAVIPNGPYVLAVQ